MWKRKEGKIFLTVHLCLLLLCLLFPLYLKLAKGSFSRFFGCVLHDYLFLYCPVCGGTRAISALLHFEFLDAIRYNALVVALVLFALALDVIALIRLLQKKKTILRLPGWSWILMAVLLIAFGVLRNILMIGYGYDPTGDLGAIWQIIKK
ncbi:MAG: DUF2752 domain-containing protein [Clostridia bacterium]|nr:DUF2752 domain-containing protein [Clostridia bacterium]